jgi:UDP-glucose 4-epimerase
MTLNGKIIAVTGSSGFVGSHLCKEIIRLGGKVIELDITSGTDITDYNSIKDIPDFDCLIHLAAKIFVPESYKNPHSYYKINLQGTLNVCELCRVRNAKIIFASSYFYGTPEYLPIDENHPVHPHNPYAHSKLLAEELCRAYSKDFSMKVIILRFFNIYGPGQDERFLIPSIIKQAQTGEVNLGDSTPKRDFIYIDDVVSSYIHSIAFEPEELEIFNIGSGESYSVLETVNLIAKHYPKPFKVNFSEQKRANEVPDTRADISKAKRLLKWAPFIFFEKGLKNVILS